MHLKKHHLQNKEKPSFLDAKPLILQSDIFLIVYVIYYVWFYIHTAWLHQTTKAGQRRNTGTWQKKETWYLSHQRSPHQPRCTSIAKGDCIWIILGVFWQYSKHCRCLQTLKERVFLSGGAGSLSCQPRKDFLLDRTLCPCGSLMKWIRNQWWVSNTGFRYLLYRNISRTERCKDII